MKVGGGKISTKRAGKALEKRRDNRRIVTAIPVSGVEGESIDEKWRKLDRMQKEHDLLEKELNGFIRKGLLAPEPQIVNGKKKRGAKPKVNYFKSVIDEIRKNWTEYLTLDPKACRE